MKPNRIYYAAKAKILFNKFPYPKFEGGLPPHSCSYTCLQPYVFGFLTTDWNSLDNPTLFANWEIHKNKWVEVWAHFPFCYESVDLTRYVLHE
jgi:hypothetical protein